MSQQNKNRILQDLHIHTVFSSDDSMVVPEQTMELISRVKHADVIGISDHYESLHDNSLELYMSEVMKYGFKLGTEVDGPDWINDVIQHPFDYYLYHCYDTDEAYENIYLLMETGKPVIVSHPAFMGTDLSRVPEQCFIEINNRYIWRSDWKSFFTPFLSKFKFHLW